MRPAKIKKAIQERMADCETHLSFLWDARQAFRTDRERYKQIAGELRILVCEFKNNRALLLDMMDHFSFEYHMNPPGPPLQHQPILLVGWRDDPNHKELVKAVADARGDAAELESIRSTIAARRVALPLRRYIDEGLAAFVTPKDYSFANLVRLIAEQSGGAHEDEAIDETYAAMRQVHIGGDESHIRALVSFADTILEAGAGFLGFMVRRHGYQLRRFVIGPPPTPSGS